MVQSKFINIWVEESVFMFPSLPHMFSGEETLFSQLDMP